MQKALVTIGLIVWSLLGSVPFAYAEQSFYEENFDAGTGSWSGCTIQSSPTPPSEPNFMKCQLPTRKSVGWEPTQTLTVGFDARKGFVAGATREIGYIDENDADIFLFLPSAADTWESFSAPLNVLTKGLYMKCSGNCSGGDEWIGLDNIIATEESEDTGILAVTGAGMTSVVETISNLFFDGFLDLLPIIIGLFAFWYVIRVAKAMLYDEIWSNTYGLSEKTKKDQQEEDDAHDSLTL